MPHSSTIFDASSKGILVAANPALVIDIGCGSGKYAEILRQHCPRATIIGYEQESSYVERFQLVAKYDQFWCESAERVMYRHIRDRFDICIFGDVLEHLRKSLGIDLVHFLLYRSRYILLVVPIRYLQDDFDGVPTEAHVSSWHVDEFAPFTDVMSVTRDDMSLALLRGYLCDDDDFENLRTIVQDIEHSATYIARR